MKTTTLTILLGLTFTLGTVVTSRAENQQTIRIPQGRGQFIEVPAAKATPTRVNRDQCLLHCLSALNKPASKRDCGSKVVIRQS